MTQTWTSTSLNDCEVFRLSATLSGTACLQNSLSQAVKLIAHTYPAKTRTTTDGTLRLAIPTGVPGAEIDVLVVFDMVPPSTAKSADSAAGWPSGYLEEFFGALRDESLVRHVQGDFEERQPLS